MGTMTTYRRHTIDSGGVNLAVIDEGPRDGTAVLLVHGFPDSADMWRHQIPALVGAGYRVVAPDLRGLGQSDRPGDVEEYRLRRSVNDLEDRPRRTAGPVVMGVQGIGRGTAVQDVSLELRAGEVFGIAGLVGSGRTELLRLLFGADRADRGSITLHDDIEQREPLALTNQALAVDFS